METVKLKKHEFETHPLFEGKEKKTKVKMSEPCVETKKESVVKKKTSVTSKKVESQPTSESSFGIQLKKRTPQKPKEEPVDLTKIKLKKHEFEAKPQSEGKDMKSNVTMSKAIKGPDDDKTKKKKIVKKVIKKRRKKKPGEEGDDDDEEDEEEVQVPEVQVEQVITNVTLLCSY